MIINGGSRCNARFFARHLSDEDENERVTLCDIRYLAAENLTDALHEMEVVAIGVRNAEPGREQGTDGGLPGARYAHDHDDMGGTHRCLTVSVDT